MATEFVFLDYAATAPLVPEAAAALEPYLVPGAPGAAWADANANALYGPGRAAFRALEDARAGIASALGARPDEIIFTSGATEADNAAIFGMARAADAARRLRAKGREPRLVISAIEHDAVLNPARRLTREGFALTVLPVDRGGFVSAEALAAAITDDTVLVSIQAANGEIGSVQDIAALAAVARKAGVPFHADATQALGKMPLDLRKSGIDAASFSAHKVGGPKGVGFLYLKAHTPFDAPMLGGGQENGRRSGTQNVAGAVACAAAVKAAVAAETAESARLRVLRDRLYDGLTALPGVHATVPVEPGSTAYLPGVVNVHVDGREGNTLVLRFNGEGFCVSAGSACSSGSLDPSHVLTALGIARDAAQGELRVSFGRFTTEVEIDRFLEAAARVIGGYDGR